MSGTDGVELCRRIRATDGDQPVHFIMLTHTPKNRGCWKPIRPKRE